MVCSELETYASSGMGMRLMKQPKNMRQLMTMLALCLASLIGLSQTVEVTGKLKVSDMDTSDTENLLVVKQVDGTLATRQMSSLPPPTPDTSRTWATDLDLTKILCDCDNNMPPYLVASTLAAGYSVRDLFDAGVSNGSLFNSGVSISVLVGFGATVEELLADQISPLDILNSGIPERDFNGANYAGGLIFYIASDGTGLVSAPSDQAIGVP